MNKSKLFLTALLLAGFMGCKDFLVETPQESVELTTALTNADGLRGVVTGLYDAIQSANIAGGNYNVIPEIMADNVIWKGSFTTYLDFHNRQMTPDNPNTVNWWTASYRAINLANLILDAV